MGSQEERSRSHEPILVKVFFYNKIDAVKKIRYDVSGDNIRIYQGTTQHKYLNVQLIC
jgi:hypothetical protein